MDYKKTDNDRKRYYTSYLAAIIGGLASAYLVTDHLTDLGAAKETIAAWATIAKSTGFILANIAAYALLRLHNYKKIDNWYNEIKKDSKSLFLSGMGSSIVAVPLRGIFHYALMSAGTEARVAMFIGYCASGGLPTYLKYRSDLKSNVVEKKLGNNRRAGEIAVM